MEFGLGLNPAMPTVPKGSSGRRFVRLEVQ